jgi:hypothetical protein
VENILPNFIDSTGHSKNAITQLMSSVRLLLFVLDIASQKRQIAVGYSFAELN